MVLLATLARSLVVELQLEIALQLLVVAHIRQLAIVVTVRIAMRLHRLCVVRLLLVAHRLCVCVVRARTLAVPAVVFRAI